MTKFVECEAYFGHCDLAFSVYLWSSLEAVRCVDAMLEEAATILPEDERPQVSTSKCQHVD